MYYGCSKASFTSPNLIYTATERYDIARNTLIPSSEPRYDVPISRQSEFAPIDQSLPNSEHPAALVLIRASAVSNSHEVGNMRIPYPPTLQQSFYSHYSPSTFLSPRFFITQDGGPQSRRHRRRCRHGEVLSYVFPSQRPQLPFFLSQTCSGST